MKKCKVHSVGDELFEKCSKRVVIHRDMFPPNPLKDYDQTFYLHSLINDISGNEDDKNYPDPLVEIEDEDGYGTGEYKCRDGVVAFWVSAYIHSGIALSLGTVRCAFGDTPIPGGGGRGFDTTPNAAFMWTNKERFEKMNGPWMEVYDDDTKTRRPAKDHQEFLKYLKKIAEGELELFQKFLDGECYWFDTQIKRSYIKTYENGETEKGHDWEDGGESCGGYYVDDVGDIDFPKEEGWEVFADDDCSNLVGDEYNIREFVILRKFDDGVKFIKFPSENGISMWTPDINDAYVYRSWGQAQVEAQRVIPKEEYDAYKNIKEIDDLRGK